MPFYAEVGPVVSYTGWMTARVLCLTCTGSTIPHFAGVHELSAACVGLMKYAMSSSVIAIHQSGLCDFELRDPN